jgi:hypothetical protein
VAPASSAVNAKVAAVAVVVPDGPPVMETVGGVVSGGSKVHAAVAGGPVLPARSVARTANVCAPGASAA